MTIIRNCPFVSANNGIMITNDLLITAAWNSIIWTNNTGIITSNLSDDLISIFYFISNRIIITDNFCIAAINDFILLTGNICIDVRNFCIRIGNGIVISIGYSIRQSYTGDASGEDEGSEGGDG